MNLNRIIEDINHSKVGTIISIDGFSLSGKTKTLIELANLLSEQKYNICFISGDEGIKLYEREDVHLNKDITFFDLTKEEDIESRYLEIINDEYQIVLIDDTINMRRDLLGKLKENNKETIVIKTHSDYNVYIGDDKYKDRIEDVIYKFNRIVRVK